VRAAAPALDPASGALLDWRANGVISANFGSVSGIASVGPLVSVTGRTSGLGGIASPYGFGADASTGRFTAWNPGVEGATSVLAADDARLYVGTEQAPIARQPAPSLLVYDR
jgi:hypothetical protein